MLKRLWKWFSSHAVWDSAKWLWGTGGAAVILALRGWATGHQDLAALLILAVVAVILAVVSRVLRRPQDSIQVVAAAGAMPSKPVTRVEATVLNHLYTKWAAYGDIYERLDYDNRSDTSTRFPFNPASWPAFGEQWSYVHVSLYCMSQALSAYKRDTLEIIKAFGWEDEVCIPRVEPAAIMVDVLRDIREFTRQLESIRQRQVWPQ